MYLLADDGERHACGVTEAAWRRMDEGSVWVGRERVVGGGVTCDSFEPAGG